ncbi:phage tail length tape measure family protein [Glaciecola sp. KUL10]|uniref:phage tail length tape measure family protein n=1 Tax=Glaciecola sp. (strain KUL10) TaxID=2161813 RepID=UPI000D78BA67|nr:phage tail length tape measure family protein [Glaciecola sp. KUL10]GBL02929.1 hypothetical protein KUL10_02020 [Glaciecola sp. KUL10]
MTKHTVEINANTKKHRVEFGKSVKANKAFSDSLQGVAQGTAAIDGPLGGVSSRISVMTSIVRGGNLAIVGFGAAIAGLTAGTIKSIKVFDQYEKQQLRTEALVKATGAAAGFSAQQLAQQADEVALNTLASVGGIVEAQNVLLTFKAVSGESFKQAIRLSQDMAATFGGSAKDKALQLGKALEDPINGLNALRRSGVSFTESEKDMIRSMQEAGDIAGAQAEILSKLESQVGGAGSAEAGGLSGAVDTLSQRWDELLLSWSETSSSGSIVTSWINDIGNGLKSLRGEIAPTVSELEQQLAKLEASRGQSKMTKRGRRGQSDESLNAEIATLKEQILIAKAESEDLDAIQQLISDRRQRIAELDEKLETASSRRKRGGESDKVILQRQKQAFENEIALYQEQTKRIEELEETKAITQQKIKDEQAIDAEKSAAKKAEVAANTETKQLESDAREIERRRSLYDQIHQESLAVLGREKELEEFKYQRKVEQMEKELQLLRDKGLLTQEIEAEHKAALEDLETAHLGRISQIRLDEQEKLLEADKEKKAQELAEEENRQGVMTESYQNLLGVMGNYFDGMEGKRAKYASAAVSIGQTLLDEEKRNSIQSIFANTYETAMKAYKSLAPIPVVGPALGVAAAGLVIAAGTGYAAKVSGLASYDGGGYTGDGIRSGGLDGKGGMLAMVHPRETIIDHTKQQNLASQSNINMNLSIVSRREGDIMDEFNMVKKPMMRMIQSLLGAPI